VVSNDKSEYLLYDLVQNETKPYHASDMKPFDPLQKDPLDIARKDYLEFFVEKVLDMTGDPKKVTTLILSSPLTPLPPAHSAVVDDGKANDELELVDDVISTSSNLITGSHCSYRRSLVAILGSSAQKN
jgi:hypothetical protein